MGMDDAIDFRPDLEDFRMDVDLAVTLGRPGNHLALHVDGQDVVHRDFVKADAMGFHQEATVGIVRMADANVAACEVALALVDEHFAGQNQVLFEKLGSQCPPMFMLLLFTSPKQIVHKRCWLVAGLSANAEPISAPQVFDPAPAADARSATIIFLRYG